jgi:hypothetical protein
MKIVLQKKLKKEPRCCYSLTRLIFLTEVSRGEEDHNNVDEEHP